MLLTDALEQHGHRKRFGLLGQGFLVHEAAGAKHVHDVVPEGIAGLGVLLGEFEGGILSRVEGTKLISPSFAP